MRTKSLATLALSAALMSVAHLACATDIEATAAAPLKPPCSEPRYRAFDFWLGHWDVFNAAGDKVGESRITREENGCLLVERWTAANGSTGQSYNFVDHRSGRWRQVWVSPGLTIDYSGGLDADGAMVLEGHIGYADGRPGHGARFRGTWLLNEDGSLTQHFQQHDAGSDRWTDWFVGTYRRRE